MKHEIKITGEYQELEDALEKWKESTLGKVGSLEIEINSYDKNHTAIIHYKKIPEMKIPIGFGIYGGVNYENVFLQNPGYIRWFLKNVHKLSQDKRIRLKEITGQALNKLEKNYKEKYPDRL